MSLWCYSFLLQNHHAIISPHHLSQAYIEQSNEDRAETIKGMVQKQRRRMRGGRKEGEDEGGRERQGAGEKGWCHLQSAANQTQGGRERARLRGCVYVCECGFFFLALQHQHTEATINLLERKKHKTSPEGREGKYQIRKERVPR